MNSSAEALADVIVIGHELMNIPQTAAIFGVDAACCTDPTQSDAVGWAAVQEPWTVHRDLDGQDKFRHGVWILLTLGTHLLTLHGES